MPRRTTAVAGALAAAALAATALAAPASARPASETVWDKIQTSEVHTVLEFAVETAGLDGVLDAPGADLTVFAPTDAAFEKVADELAAAGIGDGTVGTLAGFLVANGLLDDVLLYHVTEGNRPAASVVPKRGERGITTLLGATIRVNTAGQIIDASGATSNAAISAANLRQSNGTIHVIENVLVPLS